MNSVHNQVLDITPTPRILRTLGEIPFLPWQCLAELIDNSIDAFLSDENKGINGKDAKINISWTGEQVAAAERTVEVTDNASGMSLEQMQNAVRAGYSSNDPINNLGLFGMGFNIATARLGEKTMIWSTRSGDKEWIGLEIDFAKMIALKKFDAHIITQQKQNIQECGTKIIIKQLKQGIRDELSTRENEIRRQLESIYSPLLNSRDISIYIKGVKLFPKNHCVWASSRYVMYNQQTVPAQITIDRDLGSSFFDLDRNSYLTPDEAEPFNSLLQSGGILPDNIVERSKRLTGWLGIQRYADPNNFGVDFVRNGRKILIADKSLFQYENPFTGQSELQYPLELGTSVGGRIVGELHVDYLLPTYQKNGFDKTDYSWVQTIEAICGVGPFLPKTRKNLGFTEPLESPLGLLVNAYRRIDQGTKCLFAPNDLAKKYAIDFRNGKRDYINDDLWWKAAQEEDQKRITGGAQLTTTVNTGSSPSDDVDDYLNNNGNSGSATASLGNANQTNQQDETQEKTSQLDDLIKRATLVGQLSGKYSFGIAAPLEVRVYELNSGCILDKGNKKPCFFNSEGTACNFVYDPYHQILTQYPITAKNLLLIYLAEKLKARDRLPDIVSTFSTLTMTMMSEAKIDRQSLQDRASQVFTHLREKLAESLKEHAEEVVSCIHEASGEVEDTITRMLFNSNLIRDFQEKKASGFNAIEFVPDKTLLRLVERFPEYIFDGKVFVAPYLCIKLTDLKATERSRAESKDRILSFLKDALRVITNSSFGQKEQKNELSRASLSIDFLIGELI